MEPHANGPSTDNESQLLVFIIQGYLGMALVTVKGNMDTNALPLNDKKQRVETKGFIHVGHMVCSLQLCAKDCIVTIYPDECECRTTRGWSHCLPPFTRQRCG